ncbi:MAG: thioredoxin domain-containing protein [Nitrosopumilus sp.]|nr:thioredoxin domain-containing protein [Nitrosopumilus sp.]MDC4231620.1 DsbA family protein [Nitrosopumilus sp.]
MARKKESSGNSKAKFAIAGIIVVVIIGIFFFALNNESNVDESETSILDTLNGSPLLGSSDASVKIIEFGDYQCPFCKRWNQDTKPLIEENYINTGKVNLVYVDFAIIGDDSKTVHEGSYCADDQGLYWQYHDFVYTNQGHENDGWANAENLKTLVSGLDGLDVDSFKECLDSKKYKGKIQDNIITSHRTGAQSTPSFIIVGPNDFISLKGAQPYDAFSKAIDVLLVN